MMRPVTMNHVNSCQCREEHKIKTKTKTLLKIYHCMARIQDRLSKNTSNYSYILTLHIINFKPHTNTFKNPEYFPKSKSVPYLFLV